jgi:hypothetical protein
MNSGSSRWESDCSSTTTFQWFGEADDYCFCCLLPILCCFRPNTHSDENALSNTRAKMHFCYSNNKTFLSWYCSLAIYYLLFSFQSLSLSLLFFHLLLSLRRPPHQGPQPSSRSSPILRHHLSSIPWVVATADDSNTTAFRR